MVSTLAWISLRIKSKCILSTTQKCGKNLSPKDRNMDILHIHTSHIFTTNMYANPNYIKFTFILTKAEIPRLLAYPVN